MALLLLLSTDSGGAPTGVIGDLAASETSNDTFSASGLVVVLGSKAASELVSDSFVSTASLLSTGAGSLVETGADVLAATGNVSFAVTGTLSVTESGGGVPFGGVSAVMKYWNGSSWQVLYKDPTIYT